MSDPMDKEPELVGKVLGLLDAETDEADTKFQVLLMATMRVVEEYHNCDPFTASGHIVECIQGGRAQLIKDLRELTNARS